jgi:heterotetrameric sarcosine oxidase delta subunit
MMGRAEVLNCQASSPLARLLLDRPAGRGYGSQPPIVGRFLHRTSLLGLRIRCPNCGSRPYTEFWYFGEVRLAVGDETAEQDFERVWMRDNTAGLQTERWFHYAGCRRCITLSRDTTNNRIDA